MRRIRALDIREKAPLLAAVLLVGLAANAVVAFLVNLPRSEKAASLRAADSEFHETLVRRRQKVEGLRREYERIVGGRRSLETFYDEVLSTKRQRMVAVQKEIRDIAAKFNINPETITYSRDIFKKDPIVKFSAVLPLTGSYENLRAFINAVENSENFLIIEGINLTDSKEGGVILSLNITIATYFFDKDVEALGAGRGRA